MLLAYIDPAIGSMLLQAMAAIVLAGGLFFRRIFFAPLAWLGGKRAEKPEQETPEGGPRPD
jgi:hypothetical protein